MNLLLDFGWSIFQLLCSANDLSKLEVDVDTVESHMEHPGTEIKHEDDAKILIGSLEEGGSYKHK